MAIRGSVFLLIVLRSVKYYSCIFELFLFNSHREISSVGKFSEDGEIWRKMILANSKNVDCFELVEYFCY